jgi:hypothetical protein
MEFLKRNFYFEKKTEGVTNILVKELSHILIITKIEHLLHTLQGYFARSPKCHIEFTNLSKVMHIKGR